MNLKNMVPIKDKVYGCGLDIEEVNRFDKYSDVNDYSLMSNICSKRELDNFQNEYIDKRVRLALSFTCKEAFYKALGRIWATCDISWKDIEILFNDKYFNDYSVILSENAKNIFLKNNIKLGEIWFNYNDAYVVFQIILLGETAKA